MHRGDLGGVHSWATAIPERDVTRSGGRSRKDLVGSMSSLAIKALSKCMPAEKVREYTDSNVFPASLPSP